MVEKKIVDDYYSSSSIEQDLNSDIKSDDNKKKVKIISKKKITIIKKDLNEDKKEEKEKEEENEKEKIVEEKFKIGHTKEDKNTGFKKIEERPRYTVKRQEDLKPKEKTTFVKNNNQIKTNINKTNNNHNNSSHNNSSSNKVNNSHNSSNNNNQVKSNFTTPNKDFTSKTKVFSSDTSIFNSKLSKNPKTSFQDEDYKKKPKLSPFYSKKTRGRFDLYEEDKELTFTRSNKIIKKVKEEKKIEDIKQNLINHSGETVVIGDVLSLKEFGEKIGITLPVLISEFMKNGMMVNINSKIDFETASIVAESFNIKLDRDKSAGMNVEDVLEGNLDDLLYEDDKEKLKPRPPVVSIMGHVDHGKTSLLDYIRKSKVALGEAGGITQSIGAYQVEKKGHKITFMDTPGHEAFTIMRARGAKLTDIAILVVAADEGVKPQTIESISHAKIAGIPIIVAINKMDKIGANPDHVKGQLAEHGITPEEWGGDTPVIPVSAHSGLGIEDLLDIIIMVSEMKELKANPNRDGVATVVESHLDTKLGPVATVLINAGTIKSGDNIVCKEAYGKVKILKDFTSKNIKLAIPGDPVLIVGLDKVVEGGDIMQVVLNSSIARQKSIDYSEIMMRKKQVGASGLELLMSKIKAGNLKQLKIVLKADTNGSLEAIKNSLLKLSTKDTSVNIIYSGVGSISEGDILMCQGTQAILIGFGVECLNTAKGLFQSSQVEFINSDIIYHITEKIEKIITGMLDPKEIEIILANASVGGIFYTSKEFMVLGLHLKEGDKIQQKTQVRVFRDKKYIGKGKILSLKKGVEEVKEIEGPTECGIKFSGNIKVEEKDILEIYKIEIQK